MNSVELLKEYRWVCSYCLDQGVLTQQYYIRDSRHGGQEIQCSKCGYVIPNFKIEWLGEQNE